MLLLLQLLKLLLLLLLDLLFLRLLHYVTLILLFTAQLMPFIIYGINSPGTNLTLFTSGTSLTTEYKVDSTGLDALVTTVRIEKQSGSTALTICEVEIYEGKSKANNLFYQARLSYSQMYGFSVPFNRVW